MVYKWFKGCKQVYGIFYHKSVLIRSPTLETNMNVNTGIHIESTFEADRKSGKGATIGNCIHCGVGYTQPRHQSALEYTLKARIICEDSIVATGSGRANRSRFDLNVSS